VSASKMRLTVRHKHSHIAAAVAEARMSPPSAYSIIKQLILKKLAAWADQRSKFIVGVLRGAGGVVMEGWWEVG